jgi:hypothetical protein
MGVAWSLVSVMGSLDGGRAPSLSAHAPLLKRTQSAPTAASFRSMNS